MVRRRGQGTGRTAEHVLLSRGRPRSVHRAHNLLPPSASCLPCLRCARGIIVLPLRAGTVPRVEDGRPQSLSSAQTLSYLIFSSARLSLNDSPPALRHPLFDPATRDSQQTPRPRPLTTILALALALASRPLPASVVAASSVRLQLTHIIHPCRFCREAEVAWPPSRCYTVKLRG
jgi:hypothetical protein